jgi:hypothetical protein
MRELRREIDIEAPPAAVWAVLTDTRSYSEWNPFMARFSGELREGAKLEVRIEPPGGRAMTFKPTVLCVEPDRELRWRGRLLLPGVFDGEHILHIEPLDQNRSRFTQAERFSGILVRLFRSTLDKTELGFEQMNSALRARVEGRLGTREGPAKPSPR